MSAFLDFLLQPLAQAVKLYIKDTNHFLNKLCSLPKLPDNMRGICRWSVPKYFTQGRPVCT